MKMNNIILKILEYFNETKNTLSIIKEKANSDIDNQIYEKKFVQELNSLKEGINNSIYRQHLKKWLERQTTVGKIGVIKRNNDKNKK